MKNVVRLSFRSGVSSVLVTVTVLVVIALRNNPSAPAIETITAAELKSNLYFLASDEMRGRGTNTPFNAITSRYLAHRFELDGLKTARDHSSYFQSFGLVQAQLSSPNRLEIQTADFPLAKMGLVQEDFYPSPITANGRVIGSVVFAGYGITAPEHSYDDYAGIDAKGKMVLVMLSEPGERDSDSPFEGAIQSEYGGALHKILNAQKHGAAGILLFRGQAKNFNQSIFPRRCDGFGLRSLSGLPTVYRSGLIG